MRIVLLIITAMLTMGATWYTGSDGLDRQWYVDTPVKWAKEGSAFKETSGLDAPRRGFTRNFDSVVDPYGVTSWTLKRFRDLTENKLDKKWLDEAERWYKDPLPASTKWIDAKAGPDTGQVKFSLTGWSDFTVFRIDPPDGYVDQDFQGNAIVHGLADDKRYKVHAWDGKGYLGAHTLSISDKFIRALPTSNDSWGGGRIPAMAQKVVADPNDDLWMSVYRVEPYGLNYRFVRVYSIGKDGQIRADFQVPLTTSYIRSWDSDLILEDDGDLTFCATETPEAYTAYLGNAYIARLHQSGDTVWEAPMPQVISATSIIKALPTGYIYGGINSVESGDAYQTESQLNERWGNLCRIGTTGYQQNWGSSGATKIAVNHRVRSMIQGASYTYSYETSGTEIIATAGGSAYSSAPFKVWDFMGSDVDQTDWDDVFDGCYWVNPSCWYSHWSWATVYSNREVQWRFGSGNAQTVNYSLVYLNTDQLPLTIYKEYSDDLSTWTSGTSTTIAVNPYPNSFAMSCEVGSHPYWRLRFSDIAAQKTLELAEWDLYHIQTLTGTGNYFYTCGQRNIFGPVLTTTPGGACADSEGIGDCALAFNGTLATGIQFSPPAPGVNNATLSYTFASAVDVTWSKAWFYNVGDPTTIYLEYHDGATWQTIDSTTIANLEEKSWTVLPNVGNRTQFRLRFAYISGDLGYMEVKEWQMHNNAQLFPIISAFDGASGVSEGVRRWDADWRAGSSGFFHDLTQGTRTTDIYAVGHSGISQSDMSQNSGIIGCASTSGVSKWLKTYDAFSVIHSISPAVDGGFFLSGTKYQTSSTSGARSAVVSKIDKDGNVDPKFPQTFAETNRWADGRGVIETSDNGALMVGGSSDSATNTSRPWYIKLDRYLRSRTKGQLYN